MRYKIKSFEIRSENAAKPASSAGRWILEWIRRLPRSASGLDIGCGKLRYTAHLAARIKSVTGVDSDVQLDRKQTLFGKTCSIRDYVSESLPNVRVYSANEAGWKRTRYNVILCSNVLSAIPCKKTRRKILRRAYGCLMDGGQFLLTTQYRNSYFNAWRCNSAARRFLDGFLVEGRRGTSFYGLLDARALTQLCRVTGFRILDSGHADELAFVLASRGKERNRS
jgi:SAM-dependent methyltransferase